MCKKLMPFYFTIVLFIFAPQSWGLTYEDAMSAGKKGDFETALQGLKPLAEQGHAAAQYNLATLYQRGLGLPKDIAKAIYWYERAAEQNHISAQFNLGNLYYEGLEVPRNRNLAIKWYTRAAQNGDAVAQYNVGQAYYNGDGVEQSFPMALLWNKQAALQRHGKAQHNLGVMYRDGIGTERNLSIARLWFQQAAQNNVPRSQADLGYMHAMGKGVEKNYIRAFMWWSIAADTGLKIAMNNLNTLKSRMTVEEIAQANELALKCAAKKFRACYEGAYDLVLVAEKCNGLYGALREIYKLADQKRYEQVQKMNLDLLVFTVKQLSKNNDQSEATIEFNNKVADQSSERVKAYKKHYDDLFIKNQQSTGRVLDDTVRADGSFCKSFYTEVVAHHP